MAYKWCGFCKKSFWVSEKYDYECPKCSVVDENREITEEDTKHWVKLYTIYYQSEYGEMPHE